MKIQLHTYWGGNPPGSILEVDDNIAHGLIGQGSASIPTGDLPAAPPVERPPEGEYFQTPADEPEPAEPERPANQQAVESLGLTPTQRDALVLAGLNTVADIIREARQNNNSLVHIPRIGPQSSDTILHKVQACTASN